MARTRLNKTERLVLRITPEQKRIILEKATEQNITMNDYCSRILFDFEHSNKVNEILKNKKEQTRLISKISNNINQLAAHCNTYGVAPSKDVLIKILKELRVIYANI